MLSISETSILSSTPTIIKNHQSKTMDLIWPNVEIALDKIYFENNNVLSITS